MVRAHQGLPVPISLTYTFLPRCAISLHAKHPQFLSCLLSIVFTAVSKKPSSPVLAANKSALLSRIPVASSNNSAFPYPTQSPSPSVTQPQRDRSTRTIGKEQERERDNFRHPTTAARARKRGHLITKRTREAGVATSNPKHGFGD